MDDVDNKIMTQPEKVEYILNKGCEFLGLTREDVLEGGVGYKSAKWQKKRYLIPVLSDYTILTPTEISQILGYCDVASLLKAKEVITKDISGELYGSKKIKLVYDELLTYLKLNNHENKETNQTEKTSKGF